MNVMLFVRTAALAAAAAVFAHGAPARADEIFAQTPSTSGTLIQSSWIDPDGSDADQRIWDNFTLTSAATITEVRWRGGFRYGGAYGGPVVDFEIAVFPSIAAGTEPDVVHPPLFRYYTGGSAGQTPAGTFGGVAMYDYHSTLPAPFQAAAGTKYWLQIVAWQHGSVPEWGFCTATSTGSHYRKLAEYMFQFAPGDAAFTLLGQSACIPAAVATPPQPVAACPGGDAVFTVDGSGSAPLEHRWRRDGSPLSDGPTSTGSVISGSRSPVLTISGVALGDAGSYDCMVSNGCGAQTSAPAPLTVCGADLTCDGLADFGDYLEFLNLYDAGDHRADFNGDGLVDFGDYLEFLNLYDAGC